MGNHESYYQSNVCNSSPMEHVIFKTNCRAITRIKNGRRKSQFQSLNFFKLGNDLHVLKSAASRNNLPNLDVQILNEQSVEPRAGDNFDAFCSRMRLVYYVNYENDECNCACAFFWKHVCYKNIVRFSKTFVRSCCKWKIWHDIFDTKS